ncbi:MAG: SDR family NAD(P)-dependent oxidoreductase [Hydrotalea sp.]|nr:SDR family NAD(P)-dependent oxidoreductase [Hydrotalea sp.]
MAINFYQKKIWLIGGSRGMGLELARQLISAGAAVTISSRQPPKGIDKKTYRFVALDVADDKALKKTCKDLQPLDGVIYMPALYEPGPIVEIDEDFLAAMTKVNMQAPTMLAKYLARHLEQRRGFLAICGSQAGEVGLPLGQPYSASKAYLKNFCQSLSVEHPGLTVQLIAPGFVKTDLTAKNKFAMPFVMTAEAAAACIMRGIKRQKNIIIFPKRLTWILKTWAILPLAIKKLLWRKR